MVNLINNDLAYGYAAHLQPNFDLHTRLSKANNLASYYLLPPFKINIILENFRYITYFKK